MSDPVFSFIMLLCSSIRAVSFVFVNSKIMCVVWLELTNFKQGFFTIPVSYTHLDVYKRQNDTSVRRTHNVHVSRTRTDLLVTDWRPTWGLNKKDAPSDRYRLATNVVRLEKDD